VPQPSNSWLRLVGRLRRLAGGGLLAIVVVGLPATGQADNAPTKRPVAGPVLRVATGPVAPFVLKDGDGTLTGFSIDFWREIARRLKVESSWVEVGTSRDQLQAIVRGDADVAISAITMTPEREAEVDFSTSYFDSGLQIMVRARSGAAVWGTLKNLVSSSIRDVGIAAVAILFVLANILWLIERRRNPLFQKGYLRGILEGIWAVVLIIATGEYGDRETPDVARRLAVTAMWLLGVVLIAQFTATMTSSLTVQQLQSSIRGPDDLAGKRVGTVPGSVAADYLRQRGIRISEVTSADQGFDLLMHDEVDAIVFDAPTLQYWASKRGGGRVQVVGPVFRLEQYGIAVPQGSPLRKRINEALLALYAEGKYEELRSRWFGSSH